MSRVMKWNAPDIAEKLPKWDAFGPGIIGFAALLLGTLIGALWAFAPDEHGNTQPIVGLIIFVAGLAVAVPSLTLAVLLQRSFTSSWNDGATALSEWRKLPKHLRDRTEPLAKRIANSPRPREDDLMVLRQLVHAHREMTEALGTDARTSALQEIEIMRQITREQRQ